MRSLDGRRKRTIAWRSQAAEWGSIGLPLLLMVSGCGVAPDRSLQVVNACLIRHPHDAPLCEAPRQAYQVDVPTVAARSAPGLGIRQ
jgi:hypothetical protein